MFCLLIYLQVLIINNIIPKKNSEKIKLKGDYSIGPSCPLNKRLASYQNISDVTFMPQFPAVVSSFP